MAQGKVTDFFSNKKQSNLQASKRRKLQQTSEIDLASAVFAPGPKESKSSVEKEVKVISKVEGKILNLPTNKAKPKASTRASSRVKKTIKKSEQLTTIKDAFKKVAEKSEQPAVEETTAIEDDHNGSIPSTPTKRQASKTDTEPTARKRNRTGKTQRKDMLKELMATPERGFDFDKFVQKDDSKTKGSAVRKRLVLKKSQQGSAKLPILNLTQPVETNKAPSTSKAEDETSEVQEESSKDLVIKRTKDEWLGESKSKDDTKQKKKPTLAELKARMGKSTKLADLQDRLAKVSEAAAKVKKSREEREKIEIKKEEKSEPTPAYEKYHSLAQPIPPTLNLPYKYKMLAEMFRSMDTVVSMLHNRSEVTTFNKLKNSVQEMVRKTFEKKHVGQVKTVYPEAYVYRQERGLQYAGKKTSEYQLTIEPKLERSKDDNMEEKKRLGRPNMTASRMLERRNIFQHSLIDIVKQHHQKFLTQLQRPIKVPDDKITRWHPKFAVDEVPDIEVSDLPEPPEVQRFTNAKDVLDNQCNTLNPLVRKALEAVVVKKEKEESNKSQSAPVKTPVVSSCGKSALAGLPSSLLEKIRAKEAEKAVAKMMRPPECDVKLERLNRLPELARILRTYFVQEKRPAVLYDDVIQKMADSYRTGICLGDVEPHIKLLIETVPDWVTVINIKKGKYLKLDRNKDINIVHDILNKAIKEAQ
ncbi:unnamed protein product [Owenia fusiformis]|uniref:Uncharacterized protein n=1 Tax=Owenia fusiformis TaxID=6347 RepID=A0A8J1UQU7_OWEFU|nr:unnamed protein product [Owenia fusiformis]